jgi:hypothetical protein
VQVGNATNPFTRSATIQLNGVRTSPTTVVDNSYFLGNKVLAVFGRVSLAGVPRAVTWTRLSATAPAGSTSITLDQPVDWRAGDEIVLTPTECVRGWDGMGWGVCMGCVGWDGVCAPSHTLGAPSSAGNALAARSRPLCIKSIACTPSPVVLHHRPLLSPLGTHPHPTPPSGTTAAKWRR